MLIISKEQKEEQLLKIYHKQETVLSFVYLIITTIFWGSNYIILIFPTEENEIQSETM